MYKVIWVKVARKETIQTADHSTEEAARHDADARMAAYVKKFGPIAVFVTDEHDKELYRSVQS